MATTHAMTALDKKAAELRADLAHLDMLRRRALEGLAHIEATLALLQAARKGGAPNGFQRRWLFKRGELKRLILAVEREAGERMTARDTASAIIARRGWDASDRRLENLLAMKVRNAWRLMPPCAASSLSTGG